MNAKRQTGPWVFSALVSAGVHIGAVAVLVAALPPLEAPAAPTQFVLASLDAPAQVAVEAMAANTVVPAVAMASEPAGAQTVAPDRLQATRVEAAAALVSHAPVLPATSAAGAIAAPVAIAGEAAISGPQEHAGRLEPASSAPLAVTTTAAAGGTETSAIVLTASELAATGATARAEAQAGSPQPAAGTALSTASAAAAVVATGTLTAVVTADMAEVVPGVTATRPAVAAVAGATEISTAIATASDPAPMAATATAKAQAGSPQPIASAALPAANAVGTLTAAGTLAATTTADRTGVASTVPTATAVAPVSGARAEAPGPTAMLATPVPTEAAGGPAVVGTQSVPAVVGAQAPGNAGAAPVAVTAALSTSGATLAPLSPDIETVAGLDALDDYLAGYDGGDCFAVLPERPDEATVALTAFAGSPAAAGAFVEALAHDFGAILPVEARTVSQGQCGALSFVRSSALYPGFDLGLALDADAIAVGAPLSGEVLRMTGAWLTLLVIDDEGRVSNLDAYVRAEGGAIRFEAPVVPTGEAAGKTQLLLAVATAEELAVNPQDGDSAQAVLAALEAELHTRGMAAELAVGAFTVH